MKENVLKVLKVKPHEHPEVYMLKNTLEAMQEAVGGYIDIIGLDGSVCILLNDEGKLIGLEGNRRIGSDIIVGDFFVCGSDEEGNLTSLSEEELDKYTNFFYEPQEFTKEEIEETTVIEFYTFERKRRIYIMKKTNTTSEIREYTTNIDEPIVISRSLLEKAGINPYADINIHLQNGSILIQPKSILGRLPEELLLFYEEMGFSRQMVEIVLNKYAEEAGGFDELQRKLQEEVKQE